MRLALTATCITTLATLLAAEARADTSISTATTTPVRTSTGGNITITADGSIVPTTSGAAVTIDSNNTVSSAGKITFNGVNNAVGIVANGGLTSSITNSGTITIDETYTRTDTNGDTVLDGPYAQGNNRYAIRIDGTTPFTGAINNTGAITVRGNDSAAIYATAPIVGNVTANTGAISVTGNNTYGIRLGAVNGNIALSSAVGMLGGNATGVALTGDVAGQVVVHGSISTTGYSSTTLPTDVTKLTAENLQQSGSAMVIGGSVSGGVLIAAAPTDTTNTTADVDKDGIADATQQTASLTTYGSAPALAIGSATAPITLGTFTGNTNGLIVNGKIAGIGVYSGVSATGAQIGGLGAPVIINGGIAVGGQIAGSANGATAYGLRLAAGASTPQLTVSGSVGAGGSATSGSASYGVVIENGASLPTIVNSGTISAQTTATQGDAKAILDNSGTLKSVVNNGSIIAAATSGSDANQRAIDVTSNTTGFTYTQALATSTQTTTPALAGGVFTGSGNDTFTASAGVIQSVIDLGAGNDTIAISGNVIASIDARLGDGNDSITLSGTSAASGKIDFGTGNDTLTINSGATFAGVFANGDRAGSNIAVALNGGNLRFNTTDTNTMTTLNAAGGTLGVVIDPAKNTGTLVNVTGATTISAPTTLAVGVTSFGTTTNPITVLRSGTLTGSNNLTLSIDSLPYLLKGNLVASDSAGTVGVAIQRKTATDLQFRRSEAAAYDAVFAAIQGNSTLSSTFLGLTDRDSTLLRYREMLPDHQGGVFDVLTQGARTLAPTENVTPWAQVGRVNLWVQQALWDAHQDGNDTPGNGGNGWGLTGGGDVPVGENSRIGLSIGYIHGDVRDSGDNEVSANQFGGGVHWYSTFGALKFAAYGSAGYVRLSEQRSLSALTPGATAIFTSKGKWNGINAAAGAKVSYEKAMGTFYLRPSAQLSYNRLSEKAHTESGGGTGFDLSIGKRTSSEAAATGLLAAGLRFGDLSNPDAATFRIELEGGRRQIIDSKLDGTKARFANGNEFTLLPEDRKSGWIGGANASLGSSAFRFIASGVVETRSNGQRIISGRFGFRGAF
jgi:hypothetical protein